MTDQPLTTEQRLARLSRAVARYLDTYEDASWEMSVASVLELEQALKLYGDIGDTHT
jgi:hypothetical protein